MGKRILVGISNYRDRKRHLDLMLQSIRWYTYADDPEFDLVVCDDGTRHVDPESFKYTQETCEKFGATLIEEEKNSGIPTVWNHLAESMGGDSEIIIILNNDLLMPPNWLRTMVHFLDANKDNPNIGSAFWQPLQPFDRDAMAFILPQMGHTIYTAQDQVTGKMRESNHPADWGIIESKHCDGHGLGRVMCPCGCCFAFRRDVWKKVGPFDERLTSFHEESDWGTRCAEKGMASIALPYPKPYHAHGYTFAVNPELESGPRMAASRRLYCEIWNIPENQILVNGRHEYFNYMNKKLMPNIPPIEAKFLAPDYSLAPETRTLAGGESVLTPTLVEKTQVLESYEGVPD